MVLMFSFFFLSPVLIIETRGFFFVILEWLKVFEYYRTQESRPSFNFNEIVNCVSKPAYQSLRFVCINVVFFINPSHMFILAKGVIMLA
jgi:hypothetical protein